MSKVGYIIGFNHPDDGHMWLIEDSKIGPVWSSDKRKAKIFDGMDEYDLMEKVSDLTCDHFNPVLIEYYHRIPKGGKDARIN